MRCAFQAPLGLMGALFPAVLVPAVLACGCTERDDSLSLVEEGPPDVLQVFMRSRDDMGLPATALVQGSHPDWSGDIGIENAIAGPEQKIRIVVDELLRGTSVEHFVCACEASCGDGPSTAADAADCPDNPDTAQSESGRFLDANVDQLPDAFAMVPGLVTIDCGANGDWTNDAAGGWYNPSGNQFPAYLDVGLPVWDYLGPSVVVTPILPSGSDCTMTVSNDIVDKDGEPMTLDAISFSTEALALVEAMPADASVDVDPALFPTVSVRTTTLLDPATVIAANVVLSNETTMAAVPGTVALAEDGQTILFTPDAPLAAGTTYALSITGITDTYGIAAAPMNVGFQTAP